MNKKRLLRMLDDSLKEHKKPFKCEDGFPVWDCPLQENKHIRVANKKDWKGTEAERQIALKEQELMDKQVSCGFCELVKKIRGELK